MALSARPGGIIEIGVDEAGRGPLAGPVCAAAVSLAKDSTLTGLADSKALSEKKRGLLEPMIKAQSRAWGIGWASVEEIEQLDILRATFLAMSRAAQACLEMLANRMPEGFDADQCRMQVDGNHSPGRFKGPWHWPYVTETVIKGDQTIACISAASILAKTARDGEMRRLDGLYPQYGFARHCGYGTAAHLQALAEHGVCPAHRKTFAPVARHLLPAR